MVRISHIGKKTIAEAKYRIFVSIDANVNGWDEKSYATAFAIAYFAEKFPNMKDTWELIVLKTKKWLQKNCNPDIMELLITSASKYIQSLSLI